LSYLSDERGLKYGSLQSAFAGLSALFDYLVEEEETIPTNPVPSFRKRYLREYKDEGPAKRKFISVEEAAKLVNSTLDTRDRCILLMLLKTGMRRKELSTLDVGDVDLPGLTIVLKPTPKRSNRVIYFDYECADTLRRWLASRSLRKGANGPALFLNYRGTRLSDGGIANVVMKHATRSGLHDPTSRDLAKRVGPHCGRVCFSTWLDRAGMKREFIQELRGDAHRDAIDIYLRVDQEELKRSYLAHIPQLGI
jgi:integrase/recombinase XerD